MNKQVKLEKFKSNDHEVRGEMINNMLLETVDFSIGTYKELSESCYVNDWTFDNTFLFMGSVATTIGYGHIVPKSERGKISCIIFTMFSVPLFAILLQFISLYIDEVLIKTMNSINHKLGRQVLGENRIRFLYFTLGTASTMICFCVGPCVGDSHEKLIEAT